MGIGDGTSPFADPLASAGLPSGDGGAGTRWVDGARLIEAAALFRSQHGMSPQAPLNYGGRGSETGMRQLRVLKLPAQPTALNFAGFPANAMKFTAPHPIILQVQARPLAGSDPSSATNIVYAIPMARDAVIVNTGNTGNGYGAQFVAIRSTQGGVLYLPAGDYYLYYPENNDCYLGVFDARDPMFAAWMLSRPGNHVISRHPSDVSLIGGAATWTAVVLTANRWRSFFTVQNTTPAAVSGNQNIRVGFTTAPLGFNAPDGGGGYTPTTPRGYQLGPGQALTFAGHVLLTNQVQACREIGADPADVQTCTVHVMEVM